MTSPHKTKALSSIRKASLADLNAIAAIEKDAHLNPWSTELFKKSLLGSHLMWVMEAENSVVGYMVVMPVVDEWELLNVVIARQSQGKGLGRVWIQFLIEQARNTSITRILLEVRQSNQAAISLYQKSGFDVFAERKNYYPTVRGRENALIMQLML